jgi:hypothetical protein
LTLGTQAFRSVPQAGIQVKHPGRHALKPVRQAGTLAIEAVRQSVM